MSTHTSFSSDAHKIVVRIKAESLESRKLPPLGEEGTFLIFWGRVRNEPDGSSDQKICEVSGSEEVAKGSSSASPPTENRADWLHPVVWSQKCGFPTLLTPKAVLFFIFFLPAHRGRVDDKKTMCGLY